MHLSSLPYMLNALPIPFLLIWLPALPLSFLLIWLPEWYLVRGTEHKAPKAQWWLIVPPALIVSSDITVFVRWSIFCGRNGESAGWEQNNVTVCVVVDVAVVHSAVIVLNCQGTPVMGGWCGTIIWK
jgi:hypothetical protein